MLPARLLRSTDAALLRAPEGVTRERVDFASARDKARWLGDAARADAVLPMVRALAWQIAPPCFSEVEAARRFHAWCRDELTFIDDPADFETFESSDVVLWRGYDDCDGKARTFVALCLARGIDARIRAIIDHGEDFYHVQAECRPRGAAAIIATEPGGWLVCEFTLPHVELGQGGEARAGEAFRPEEQRIMQARALDGSSQLLAIPGLEKTTPGFRIALSDAMHALGIDPDFVTPVMANESGFDAQAVNPMSGASGLIQWMPATARAMGTTVEAIRQMSAEEQVPLVAAYFRPFAARIKSAGDAYMVVFMPKYVGEDTSTVIAESPAKTYTQNQVFDREHKGFITVGDVERKAQDLYDAAMSKPLIVDGDAGGGGAGPPDGFSPWWLTVPLAAGLAALWKVL